VSPGGRNPDQSAAEAELFDFGDGFVFCFNPGGRAHGWLYRRLGDGSLVSIRQLQRVPVVPGTDPAGLLPNPEPARHAPPLTAAG
jgi:hypothetical protein